MKPVAWVIGRGLLGSHLESRLRAESCDVFSHEPLPWNDPVAVVQAFRTTLADFGIRAKKAGRYRIFWAAGRGIMSSTDEDMRREVDLLASFLKALESEPNLSEVEGVVAFASSAGAIYAGCTDETITESSAPAPMNAYGRGKIEQEKLVGASATNRRGVLIARIANLYGPGQSRTKKQGLLTHIARSLLVRKPIHIFVPFDTMRDYLHAADAAADMVNAAALTLPKQCIVKIIASEEAATIASIVGLFKRITRLNPLLVTGTTALGASYPHRMRFSSRVLTESRATPRIGLPEGIAETFASERIAYAAEGMPG
jgi:UDP-glucose 4-epimerase